MKVKCFSLNDNDAEWSLLFSVSKIVIVTCALPLVGLIFCITWSLLFYFENTTATECKTWNFLPSVSAAIGNNLPQYIVWCIVISLHMPARFFIIVLYFHYNSKRLMIQKQYFAKVVAILNLTENLSLLGLSFISSTIAYQFHKNFFLTFVFTSELYMLLLCLIPKHAFESYPVEKLEIFSLTMKIRLLIVNASSFVLAVYFFARNYYCEPGAYSFFALFEYVLILSNIGFHSMAAVDFRDQYICISRKGIRMQK